MPAAATATAAAAQLPGLKRDQVQRAVGSLLKFVGDQQAKAPVGQLFEEDEIIYVTVALKKSPHPAGPRKVKPIRLPVPHPLFTTEGAEVCLFVKDSKGEGHKAAKARLAKFTAKGGVTKIIGLSKLRSKYESHEAKRQLCGSYDLFLADERVLPSLPKLIGKSFFKKKKAPIPIDIRAPSFPDAVRRCVERSTFMAPPAGSCVTVRAARSSMAPGAAVENVLAVLAGVVAHVPKRWSNVQAVYVKTGDSVALPVYQTLPDKPVRIEGAAAGAGEGASSEEEEEAQQPAKQQQAKQQRGKQQQQQKPAHGGRRR